MKLVIMDEYSVRLFKVLKIKGSFADFVNRSVSAALMDMQIEAEAGVVAEDLELDCLLRGLTGETRETGENKEIDEDYV